MRKLFLFLLLFSSAGAEQICTSANFQKFCTGPNVPEFRIDTSYIHYSLDCVKVYLWYPKKKFGEENCYVCADKTNEKIIGSLMKNIRRENRNCGRIIEIGNKELPYR